MITEGTAGRLAGPLEFGEGRAALTDDTDNGPGTEELLSGDSAPDVADGVAEGAEWFVDSVALDAPEEERVGPDIRFSDAVDAREDEIKAVSIDVGAFPGEVVDTRLVEVPAAVELGIVAGDLRIVVEALGCGGEDAVDADIDDVTPGLACRRDLESVSVNVVDAKLTENLPEVCIIGALTPGADGLLVDDKYWSQHTPHPDNLHDGHI